MIFVPTVRKIFKLYRKERAVFTLLLQQICPTLCYEWRWYSIENTIQYTQKDIVNEICLETGYSKYEVERVLEALEFVIQDKLGDKDNMVNITPFSGLKLHSKVIPSKNCNLHTSGYITSDYIIQLSADFTKHFKRKLRKLHETR